MNSGCGKAKKQGAFPAFSFAASVVACKKGLLFSLKLTDEFPVEGNGVISRSRVIEQEGSHIRGVLMVKGIKSIRSGGGFFLPVFDCDSFYFGCLGVM